MRDIKNKKQRNRQTPVEKAKNVKNSQLYRELSRYQEEGVPLWLDGRPSTSYHIAERVCEESDYMRDYQTDCENQICGIRFDRIRKGEKTTADSPGAKNLIKTENFLKKSKYVRNKHKGVL